MKKLLCIFLLLALVVCVPACAEDAVIPADDDDIVAMLEEGLSRIWEGYSCVTLNRSRGIIVVDIAADGLTKELLTLKDAGYDETCEPWVQMKDGIMFMYNSIREMFSTVHRDDLRLVVNIVNDDAYIREDYSTIRFNPLLSIGIYGVISIDVMDKEF